MRTFVDCIPCLVRQTVDSMRRATDDRDLQELILKNALKTVSEMDLNASPPVMTQRIHRIVRDLTSNNDPYKVEKAEFNRIALGLYPKLRSRLRNSPDRFEAAVSLAIAGNIVDLGANSHIGGSDITEVLNQALSLPLNGNLEAFRTAICKAERILYLTDNAGEIVFDRLLIEQLPLGKLTVAVRGFPILNDATMTDAEATGLTDLIPVIDNGSDAPGTVLEECSPQFRRYFERADLVISKGQGNYESLSDVEKPIFFLLKAKCPVVARKIGCSIGTLVLRSNSPA